MQNHILDLIKPEFQGIVTNLIKSGDDKIMIPMFVPY